MHFEAQFLGIMISVHTLLILTMEWIGDKFDCLLFLFLIILNRLGDQLTKPVFFLYKKKTKHVIIYYPILWYEIVNSNTKLPN